MNTLPAGMIADVDYVVLHYQFISANKTFCETLRHGNSDLTYLEMMRDFYNFIPVQFNVNVTAYKMLISDASELRRSQSRLAEIRRLTNLSESDENWAFITIGYNDQIITPQHMKNISNKVSSLKHWTEFKFVHEKFRESGIHHHTHFLVRTSSKIPKSKIIQYVFQTCDKKQVSDKRYIDVKTSKDGRSYKDYEKYISGDKQERKLSFCKQDSEWRKINNL